MGIPIEGAYEKLLKEEEEKAEREKLAGARQPQMSPIPLISTSISNKEDYLILQGAKHGNYEYGDLLIAKRRLALGKEVEQAAQALGLTNFTDKGGNKSFGNTALITNGHAYDYIGSINWEQALNLNLSLGGFTLNPRQHADLRQLLQEGADGRAKVCDGAGKEVSSQELSIIYDDILKKKNPWEGEWLDSKFEQQNGVWKMIYDHRLDAGGNLTGKTEDLEACIMEKDCFVDLAFNNQGLATKESSNQNYEQGKNVYFWHPRNGSVARFGAGSGRADLVCGSDPANASGRLGVRVARNFGGKK